MLRLGDGWTGLLRFQVDQIEWHGEQLSEDVRWNYGVPPKSNASPRIAPALPKKAVVSRSFTFSPDPMVRTDSDTPPNPAVRYLQMHAQLERPQPIVLPEPQSGCDNPSL